MNIIEAAQKQKRLKTLLKAMKCLDMDTVLSGGGVFSLFAPTDDAFARLPAGTIETLFREKNLLNEVLTFHLVSGRTLLAALGKKTTVPSIQEEVLTINKNKGDVTVNGARILEEDIECTNGILHVIDAVLFPQELQSADAVSIKNTFQKEGKA
jgi:uncharacterized surface protein with fasciclin (FAS1) repeats